MKLSNEKRSRSSEVRVLVATPLGLNGRGGIDRLNDAIFEALGTTSDTTVVAERLVTRGQRGLFAAQFVFFLALIKLILRRVTGKIDLLHIHLSDWGSSYRKATLGAAARMLGIPYVVHLHGAVFDEFWGAAPRRLGTAIDNLFRHSRKIVVLGSYWAETVKSRVPEAADRIVILPNATRAASRVRTPPTDSRVRITSLGQLGERKGTPQLIEALGQLSSKPGWVATIAGDGSVNEARSRIAEIGLKDRVTVPGWLGPDDTAELLSRTDVLVLPTFAENLPMVILEAFAHGVPVVSTPVGAIPEVIQSGRNGLLVPVGDVEALVAAIDQMIGSPAMRASFGEAARRDHAAKYEITTYVSTLAEIWLDLAATPRFNSRTSMGLGEVRS
ncbi:glycosyltransferase family 4 protein [Bradyrhizobium diazoefficiens]|nr:glycosyltransferase family 4 protein [Bradyrhizobium diazoefficiens]MBR0931015.1 glycosyltransferase family 4 protein [Bradyrhizobium diazoefficiens]